MEIVFSVQIGFFYIAGPQFETTCGYVEATLEDFLTWTCDQPTMSGPFRDYDHSKFWAYADYKYFVSLFDDKADIFQVRQYIPFNHGNNLFLRKDHKLEPLWYPIPSLSFLKSSHCES